MKCMYCKNDGEILVLEEEDKPYLVAKSNGTGYIKSPFWYKGGSSHWVCAVHYLNRNPERYHDYSEEPDRKIYIDEDLYNNVFPKSTDNK